MVVEACQRGGCVEPADQHMEHQAIDQREQRGRFSIRIEGRWRATRLLRAADLLTDEPA